MTNPIFDESSGIKKCTTCALTKSELISQGECTEEKNCPLVKNINQEDLFGLSWGELVNYYLFEFGNTKKINLPKFGETQKLKDPIFGESKKRLDI